MSICKDVSALNVFYCEKVRYNCYVTSQRSLLYYHILSGAGSLSCVTIHQGSELPVGNGLWYNVYLNILRETDYSPCVHQILNGQFATYDTAVYVFIFLYTYNCWIVAYGIHLSFLIQVTSMFSIWSDGIAYWYFMNINICCQLIIMRDYI